jgi:hypothetical protein
VLDLVAARERVVGCLDRYGMDLERADDYAQASQDFSTMNNQFLLEA